MLVYQPKNPSPGTAGKRGGEMDNLSVLHLINYYLPGIMRGKKRVLGLMGTYNKVKGFRQGLIDTEKEGLTIFLYAGDFVMEDAYSQTIKKMGRSQKKKDALYGMIKRDHIDNIRRQFEALLVSQVSESAGII